MYTFSLISVFADKLNEIPTCGLPSSPYPQCDLRQREDDGDTCDVAGEDPSAKSSSVCELSEREKEIIVEIVKGLSNKEIAESLFISVNTVMTHRRNISRKLQIHSPAALTIYAIVNGLVSLDDVRM